jgi:hypothetical protein
MSFKFPGKLPYRAMSEDWRRWSKTLASALLVGLPLGLSAQSTESGEDLTSRDVSEWKAEQSFESPNWSTTLELKARATIKSLAVNIAALPSLIAGEAPAATHPLYKPQSHSEFDWSASWQQEAQFGSNHSAAFWVELDCSDLVEAPDVDARAQYSVTSDALAGSKPKQQSPDVLALYPGLRSSTHEADTVRPPIPTAQTWYTYGRVIDPSVYADQTLS